MSTTTSQAPDLQTRLADAIAHGTIQACFQPIFDAQTHRVVSCEVLPCWVDVVQGKLPVRTLTPLAESLGLTGALARLVWPPALGCLHAWHRIYPDFTLLGRVSRQLLDAPDFTSLLVAELDRLDLPLSGVDLEIAESVAMEVGPSTGRRLKALSDLGFGIFIGEFGSGHSTYTQLRGQPPKGIRIDAALTRRVQGKVGAELIEAIVKVAHTSNLQTLAADVEDAETAALLTLLGVQRLQGNYFGEPMDSQGLEKLLAQDNHAP